MIQVPSPVVLVVDDDPSVCTSVKRLLRSAGYQVKTFDNTRQVLAHGRPQGPCCLILDVQFPDAADDGLQFQQTLARSGVQLPVIFISGHGDIPMSVRAIKSGAVDFLTKPFEPDRLLDVVAGAIESDKRSLQLLRAAADLRQRYVQLTPREREVFATVTSGLLNKQAAGELGIAEKTIKVHRARVMEKMAAESVADLVRMADILDVRWECAGPDGETGQPPETGFSAHQEQISLLAASRARAGTVRTSTDHPWRITR